MALNQGWTYRDRISQVRPGETVLDYYTQRYSHSTREQWCDRILSGEIQVNGQTVPPATLLKKSDRLTYDRPPWEEPDVPLRFEVLHEDADLLVIAKPSGLPVMPGGGFLNHTLLRLLERTYPGEAIVPIHRLGRGTSGLMILARSPLAKSHLTRQMRDRQIQKIYLAIASGVIEPDFMTIETPIGKVPHSTLGTVFAAAETGFDAKSELTVLERRSMETLAQVEIFTGRPHQIRIHLAAIGHPLVGDPLYGVGGQPMVAANPEESPVPGDLGYWLHAHRVGFFHPRSAQWLTFTHR